MWREIYWNSNVKVLDAMCFPHALGNKAWVSSHANSVWGILFPQNYEHWKGLVKQTQRKANVSCCLTELLPVLQEITGGCLAEQVISREATWHYSISQCSVTGQKVSDLSPGCCSFYLSSIKLQPMGDES